ncbi:TRAP transporter substrate-binding protein [Pseudonocardia nigra]|uniref:TRAP transporter substrate-binding protein n=1 Tax=Pseudonocardia nigra TaxID=1921578 RepID=UPI001C6066EE|nr:hypothetical protein [Pseudonocardia nigra]
MRERRWAPAVALAAVVTALGGCTAAGPKSGGPDPPVELVMINHDSGSGLETAPAVAWFVDRVRDLSGGQLVVRGEIGPWATHGEEVGTVAGGRADLGWVGSRVFDLLGVRELQPLHAPFLIDSYELQAAVVNDPASTAMLSAVGRLGVEPLALLADEMRFPAATARPLLGPADWRGAQIWMLESDVQRAALHALGATARYGGDPRQMLHDGTLDGVEQMWMYYTSGAMYVPAPYVTPNVVLSPRTTVLFGNPDSLRRLTAAQQRWLRQAARESIAESAEHADDLVPERIALACRYGGRIALATEGQQAALHRAVEPLYAALRADPATAGGMARIEELKARTPAEPAPAIADSCRYRPGEEQVATLRPTPLTGPGPTGELPAGTYRYLLTVEDVQLTGSNQDSMLHGSRAGVFTWTMQNGEWTATVHPSAPGIAPRKCGGWYAVHGDTAQFTTNPALDWNDPHCLPPTWTAQWTVQDGSIRWGRPSVGVLAPLFNLARWERIG